MSAEETLKDFVEKRISWIEAARAFEKQSLEGLDETGAKKARRVITSLRFLDMRRPGLVDFPEKIKGHYDNIGYLPFILGRMGDGPEFEELVNKVIAGNVGLKQLKEISTSFKKSKRAPSSNDELIHGFDTLSGLQAALVVTDSLIAVAVKEIGIEAVREKFSGRCADLATKLNCVADAEYMEMWSQRSETQMGKVV